MMAGLAVLLLAACGGGAATSGPAAPAVRITGSILGSGAPFGQGLFAYRLPGLQRHELALATDISAGVGFGLDYLGAYWLDADRALTFNIDRDGRFSRLVEASTSGPPRRIGARLESVSGFDLRGTTVLATTCGAAPGRVQTLDLGHPSEWRDLGRSCIAALSPDGKRVAFIRNRTEIWMRTLAGGRPSLRVDLSDLAAVRDLPADRRTVVTLAWGAGGVAAAMSNDPQFEGSDARNVIAVVPETGRPRVVPLPAQNIFLPTHPWQPNGNLLAMVAMPTSGGSVVRLFDPATGKVSVVAADTQWFGNVLWSPDGRILVGSTSSNALLFVDTKGRWVHRVGVGGVGLLDWRA